jgi:hypothetical protein
VPMFRVHAGLDAPRPLATRSVVSCIPTLERAERVVFWRSTVSAGGPQNTIVPMLRVGMPVWTLRVLLRRGAS